MGLLLLQAYQNTADGHIRRSDLLTAGFLYTVSIDSSDEKFPTVSTADGCQIGHGPAQLEADKFQITEPSHLIAEQAYEDFLTAAGA